ncbi:MAG: hypothetical protein ACRC9F_02795 [Metamycoplasmataceae bacterium]
MIKQKNKDKIANEFKNNYNIWSNGRLFSLILLAITLLFFIVSIVQIPFLSFIPGYTFGLIFGYYSFIFYVVFAYYAASKLFNFNIYLIKSISKIRVFHYSWFNFFLLIFGIILIIETTTYMMNNSSPFPGIDAWTINFNTWWENFTSANNALKPNIMNPGIITTFGLSILYSLGGTIVSIIFSILLISYFVFYLFFGSPINRFEKKIKEKREIEKENREYETKIVNLSFEDDHPIVVTDFGTRIIENTGEIHNKEIKIKRKPEINNNDEINVEKEKMETVPFDNPFEESDNFILSEKDTQEIKIKNNNLLNDTEFLFNNDDANQKSKNDVKIEAPSTYKLTSEIILDANPKNKKIKNKNRRK